jgi:mono/diheme cytochrome c family protein
MLDCHAKLATEAGRIPGLTPWLSSLFLVVSAVFSPAAQADVSKLPPPAKQPVDFVKEVQPLLAKHCYSCHGPEKQKSEYRLDVRTIALKGGASGAPAIRPGKSSESPLVHFIAGLDEAELMPPKKSTSPRLTTEQVGLVRAWIDQGAIWPESASAKLVDKRDWWSLKPLVKSSATRPPTVDTFISAKLAEKKLALSPAADRHTLCRRLYFDLTGLPPTPEEMDAFVADKSPGAYERLVDKLLASPRYGERWARHWLDVVHFGETHGYDKDQPRPNAWPYRDYVIRALNEDRPYARFVQEQLAGDVLFPGTRDGIEALGFIAAGPWDLIGHAEVPEEKIDGKIARHLDRDDMVANTINTFASLTVHCAQCHDHKFDPITAEDYYSLQSVFSALDRADRAYDDDPAISAKRAALVGQQRPMKARVEELNAKARSLAGDVFTALDKKITDLKKPEGTLAAAYGWHSALEPKPETVKWVQVDLGKATEFKQVVLHACSDDFNSIGAGFGFPVRFKIESANDADFKSGVTLVADETAKDFANPKLRAVSYPMVGSARYLRVTATRLAPRQNDYMFALAELEVLDATGRNLAAGAPVTSLDSIEAPVRWSRTNLTDGHYPGVDPAKLAATRSDAAKLTQAKRLVVEAMLDEKELAELQASEKQLVEVELALAGLPKPRVVYAGTIHTGGGAFKGTGASGGRPRDITILARGDVKRPGAVVKPGTISGVTALPSRFDLPPNAPESARRAALARWLTDPANPLTWRSIVNRTWQYHFGRGLVETPNDFGRMGALPSHPELLDWLAGTFRDDLNGSFKKLHRLIVTSATYRQSSSTVNEKAAQFDSGNTLLWRQNRRKLEAEAIRDSVLAVSGKLDLTMGGPSFQDFIVTHPEHSPHYEYQLADPENPALHRRSVYRFLARSQQQPWMATLDCADPSMLVEKRNQTITPLQALAQLNNQLMVVMAKHFAARADQEGADVAAKIRQAFRLALQRLPTTAELSTLTAYTTQHGLANTCRLIVNLNEFSFVD